MHAGRSASSTPAPATPRREKVVFISGVHDYRTGRRGSIQAIADATLRLGYDVSFLSVRFSLLSLLTGDSRNFLWRRANAPESANGIECYIWRTAVHPFNSRHRALNRLLTPTYSMYGRLPNAFIDTSLRAASFIIVESGLGITLLSRARMLNPAATLIYRASDTLDAIGAHSALQDELVKCASQLDHLCLLSRRMAPHFTWARDRAYAVHLGVHPPDFQTIGASPYEPGINAVAVGSMLFDPQFFRHAAAAFPDIRFHVIGSGARFKPPPNVRLYGEMPFRDTLPFIKYATFGVAPYRSVGNLEYLSQSSLKLMQYEYLGIPAVCPIFAVGDSVNRFGYLPGDAASIAQAVRAALQRAGHIKKPSMLTWDDVARRILNPRAFPDTHLAPSDFLQGEPHAAPERV